MLGSLSAVCELLAQGLSLLPAVLCTLLQGGQLALLLLRMLPRRCSHCGSARLRLLHLILQTGNRSDTLLTNTVVV